MFAPEKIVHRVCHCGCMLGSSKMTLLGPNIHTNVHTSLENLKIKAARQLVCMLIMKENEATLEKSGWSLSMYVRAQVSK